MAGLKGDLINNAYSRARISGLTVQPTPEDMAVALDRMESMAAEWDDRNICMGYYFEDSPDVNTPHNVPRKYWNAFETSLALRLLSDFGKEPGSSLIREQRVTFSRLVSSTACPQETTYPQRQPIGSGNRRGFRYRRFYTEDDTLPTSCGVNKMQVGEINDFIESFIYYLLSSEDISSYTISAGDGLTIVSDSLTTPRISYQIQADSEKSDVEVDISVTTSLSRVEKRTIHFEVSE